VTKESKKVVKFAESLGYEGTEDLIHAADEFDS